MSLLVAPLKVQLRRILRGIEQGWSPVAEDRSAEENEWAVLKLSAVKAGLFYPAEHKALGEIKPRGEYEVRTGDLLLSRANTPLLVGDVCVVGECRRRLMLSDLLYRLRLDCSRAVPSFVAYYLLSREGRAQVTADARGSSQSMVKISQEHIKAWLLPLPPLPTQRAIADFLDRKTAAIDALIEKKQKLLDLLAERRAALINQAVTKGLDPDVPMTSLRDRSELFAEMPSTWTFLRLKNLIREVKDGPHYSPPYVEPGDGGFLFLSARNVKIDCWSLDDAKYVSEDLFREFSRKIRPQRGDVLYTKGGTTGIARAVDFDEPFQVWVHIAVLKVSDEVDPFYLAYALNFTRLLQPGAALHERCDQQRSGPHSNDQH